MVRGHSVARATEIVAALRSIELDIAEITMDRPEAIGTISHLAGTDTPVGAGTVRSIDEAGAAIA